jgi:hypothetical protein
MPRALAAAARAAWVLTNMPGAARLRTQQRVFLLRRGLEKFEWVLEKYSVPRLGPSPPLGPA